MSHNSSSIIDELRNTLGKMEIALGVIGEAIVWTDDQGLVQWCNDSFDILTSSIRVKILGNSLTDLLPLKENGVHIPSSLHPCTLLLSHEETTSGVYEFYQEGQSDLRLLEINGSSFVSQENIRSGMFVIRDISDRKILEEIKLKGKALSAAANAIIITDNKAVVEWTNPAFTTMTGFTLEEVYNKDISSFTLDDKSQKKYESLWEQVLGGEIWQGQIAGLRKDGSQYTEELTATPVLDKHNDISHCIFIKQDISIRKKAEEKLKESEARKRAILRSVVDSVITINQYGIIDSVNPATENMFGYNASQMLGNNVIMLMPEPYHSQHDEYIQSYLETGVGKIIDTTRNRGREVSALKSDGTVFPIELSISEAKTNDKRLFTAIIRDISERKAGEKALQEVNKELLTKQKHIDDDLKAAAQIQQSLLPSPKIPWLKNIDVSWRFKPSTYIGGDIFNILPLDNHHIALYMLDVSGHGVPASLLAVTVSQLLQSHSGYLKNIETNVITSPTEVLQKLDLEFPIERFDKFFTIFYMVCNVETGVLTYSNAGHPYPQLIRQDGTCTPLDKGGTIIGLGNIVPFEEGRIILQEGEKIILYTDGIIEYENHLEEAFGDDRLIQSLSKNHNNSITYILNMLFDDISTFAGDTEPQDDISALGFQFRRTGS